MHSPLRIVFLCMFMPFMVTAQTTTHPNNFILINHLKAATQPNLHEFNALREIYLQDEIDEHFFAFIQFDVLPNEKVRKQISDETGIQFLNYLPQNTYYTKIPSSIDVAPLYQYRVRGIYRILPEYKISPKLSSQNFPSYILNDDGSININIIAFKNLNQQNLLSRFNAAGIQANAISPDYNIFTAKISPLSINQVAAIPFVQYLEPAYSPVKPDNLEARNDHRANYLTSDANGLHYDGTGVWVAINDDGEIGPHIDLQGRFDNSSVEGVNEGNHGDHIAGTIMGAGNLDPRVRGHAFGAQVKIYSAYVDNEPVYSGWYDIPNSYYNPGITITSTSVSDLICNEGYNSLSQMLDEQMDEYPSLIHVISAGNSGQEDCGTLPGWFNITGGHKQAKNCITVGNVDYDDKIDHTSSKGPATDGRLKPEVVAMGDDVYSTYQDNQYKSLSGTSMSCAGVSGTLAQLTQAYRDMNNGTNPRSDLMKATLMNTTDDLGWGGIDFKHGYGRINARRAYQLLAHHYYMMDSVDNGETKSFQLSIPENVRVVRVLLYWNDAPASLGAPKDLVNDLRLQFTQPNGVTLDPWILDSTPEKDSLNKQCWQGIDTLNNSEQVTLNNPGASDNYTITVSGSDVPQGPQRFVVVYEFLYNELTLTYPNGGESWTPLETEHIRWDSYGLMSNFKLEISYDNGANWNVIDSSIDSTIHQYEYVVPPANTGQALVRISRDTLSDVSDTTFSVMNVPQNLHIDTICPLSVYFAWDAVPGANAYQIFKLGTNYMQQIGVTTKTHFSIQGLNVNENDWVSVSAIGNNNAKSRRALAIEKPTGLLNCSVNNDLSVTQVVPLAGEYSSCMNLNQVPVTVTISNVGTIAVSNIELHCKADSQNELVENYVGSIAGGSSADFTFSTTVNISGEGTHAIKCWVKSYGDENPWDDSLIRTINVEAATAFTLPFYESFNSFSPCETSNDCSEGICNLSNGWRNLTNLVYDSIDWRTNSGPTPAADTGPDEDFDSPDGAGNYLYLEAGSCKFKEAQLLSPCIDLSTAIIPLLTFAYHMYGNQMGSLHLDVFANDVWHNDVEVINGNQGNAWLTDTINLTAFAGGNITLRFRGITGNGSASDVSIDAVGVFDPAAIFPSFTVNGSNCVDSTLTFNNMSAGSFTSYEWNFGDNASPSNAMDENTVYVFYSEGGNKTVTLTVSNNFASNSISQNLFINDKPLAAFTANQNYDGSFSFTNQSQNANSYLWDFGDGSFSNEANPDHAFAGGGYYVVTLKSLNDCGDDTATATILFLGNEITDSENEITIVPNPFHESIHLQMKNAMEIVSCELLDVSGKKLMSFTNTDFINQQSLNLKNLDAGMYLLQVKSKDMSHTIKLVKN